MDWADRKSGGPLGNGFADGGKKIPATGHAVPSRQAVGFLDRQAPAQVYDNIDKVMRT